MFVAHPEAHRAAMSLSAAYLVRSEDEPREAMDWAPESSRRARGFAVYAALRSLGRSGVEDLVDRCCRLARRFADRLREEPSIQILNDVVLNQVLVRVVPATGDADVATREALRRVQDERICWLGGSRWHGLEAMRMGAATWMSRPALLTADPVACLPTISYPERRTILPTMSTGRRPSSGGPSRGQVAVIDASRRAV